nr:hypothetical protein [Tanacetum cinerariifolium]
MELIPPPMLLLEVPQDYDASSAVPCLFIHSIYVMYCPYIRSLSVMLSRISFHVLYGSDGVGSYDWSFQTEEEPTNYAFMPFTSSSSSSSDNEVASCSKACTKAYATLNIYAPKPDLVFHDAPTVNETVPTTFRVKLSPTKPDTDLSQSNRPTSPIIEDCVSDSEDEYEFEHPIPAVNLKTDILKPKGHGNSRTRKACFVCKSLTHLIKDCDYHEQKMVQPHAWNYAQRGNSQHYVRMTTLNPHRYVVPTAVLTRSKLVPLSAARPVTTAVTHNNVIRPRTIKPVGTKPHSPQRRTINHRPSPQASNFPPKVTTIKAPKVNAVKGV